MFSLRVCGVCYSKQSSHLQHLESNAFLSPHHIPLAIVYSKMRNQSRYPLWTVASMIRARLADITTIFVEHTLAFAPCQSSFNSSLAYIQQWHHFIGMESYRGEKKLSLYWTLPLCYKYSAHELSIEI